MLSVVRPWWQFHLTAGALCLDFANTMSWRRSASPIERLAAYEDLASWARQVGLISQSEEASLCADAKTDPRRSRRIVGRARSLREAMFDTFAALERRQQLPLGASGRQRSNAARSLRDRVLGWRPAHICGHQPHRPVLRAGLSMALG
jgi:hypothetical protein